MTAKLYAMTCGRLVGRLKDMIEGEDGQVALPIPSYLIEHPKGRALFEDGNTDTGLPACAGCHQSDGKGNARFPRLAGQHQAYTLKQLADYKSGRRATDPLMTTVGKRLSAEEAKALAEYIAGL